MLNEFMIVWCAVFAGWDFTTGSPVWGSLMVGVGIVYIIKAARGNK